MTKATEPITFQRRRLSVTAEEMCCRRDGERGGRNQPCHPRLTDLRDWWRETLLISFPVSTPRLLKEGIWKFYGLKKNYLNWVVIQELHFSICLGKALELGEPEIIHSGGICASQRLSTFPAHPSPPVESVSHIPHTSNQHLNLI